MGLQVSAEPGPSYGVPSGNSSDGESRQEESGGWGSHMEMGKQQQVSAPRGSHMMPINSGVKDGGV